ncbi:transcriptional regulator [Pseudomonas sp. PSB18]|nr:transcriptional regulator [Pseudomonas sp. PSB18]CDF96348.1 Redox-sensing transcriptional regulator QorR [Pseudomonas sp. SHC52]
MTSRWGVLVLVILLGGMHRFSELRRKIGGVSEKMLSQTLQGLESDGLVNRKSLPVVPPHVEYSLTPLGREAAEHLEVMVNWIEEKIPEIMAVRCGGVGWRVRLGTNRARSVEKRLKKQKPA